MKNTDARPASADQVAANPKERRVPTGPPGHRNRSPAVKPWQPWSQVQLERAESIRDIQQRRSARHMADEERRNRCCCEVPVPAGVYSGEQACRVCRKIIRP